MKRGEARADQFAGRESPRAYGAALLRMAEGNGMPLVAFESGTHGHTYDRVLPTKVALPPRPSPPPRARFHVALFAVTALCVFPAAFLRARHSTPMTPEPELVRDVW